MLVPVEALVGFALVTAAISRILSVYSVLGHRRSLAHAVYLLREAEEATRLAPLTLDPAVAEQTLTNLATQLIAVGQELSQFSITSFFRGDEASRSEYAPAIRLRAAVRHGASVDLAEEIGQRFLGQPDASLPDLLAVLAADHCRQPESVPPLQAFGRDSWRPNATAEPRRRSGRMAVERNDSQTQRIST